MLVRRRQQLFHRLVKAVGGEVGGTDPGEPPLPPRLAWAEAQRGLEMEYCGIGLARPKPVPPAGIPAPASERSIIVMATERSPPK
jgi:hypothetical protein